MRIDIAKTNNLQQATTWTSSVKIFLFGLDDDDVGGGGGGKTKFRTNNPSLTGASAIICFKGGEELFVCSKILEVIFRIMIN